MTGDILEALVFLHSVGKNRQGIIHRDIKMANVLVNVEGGTGFDAVITRAVITDFGFCCTPGSDFDTPGTVRYMSPEILRSQPWGQPVDIWAMGVLLMHLWIGEEPLSSIDDHFIEGRSKTEYDPPEVNLGPAWQDHGDQLKNLPDMHSMIRQCFLHQKVEPARINAEALLETWRAKVIVPS